MNMENKKSVNNFFFISLFIVFFAEIILNFYASSLSGLLKLTFNTYIYLSIIFIILYFPSGQYKIVNSHFRILFYILYNNTDSCN